MQHAQSILTLIRATVFRAFQKAHSAKFSFCEKMIKLPFLPFIQVSHQAEVRVLDHPPVSDKKTKAD